MIGAPSWIKVGTTPFGLSLRYAGSYLVPAQRHEVILGFLAFLFQRDANLLSADRIDVVIEFQHVILPQPQARSSHQRPAAFLAGHVLASTFCIVRYIMSTAARSLVKPARRLDQQEGLNGPPKGI